MNKTKIEWTDITENFGVRGCLHACGYCYGCRLSRRINLMACAQWLRKQGALAYKALSIEERMQAYRETPAWCEDCWQFKPHLHGKIEDVKLPIKPQKIFVDSMWDWNCAGNDPKWTIAILKKMGEHPQHTYQILSKRPVGYLATFPWPNNIWIGTTVESNAQMQRWNDLSNAYAVVKFVSCEPLLGYVDFPKDRPKPDWIIIGAMTGPGAVKPKPEWVRAIVVEADRANVPIFLKHNLGELRAEFDYRQEWPR